MKKLIQKLILSGLVVIASFGFVSSALATPLEVTFTPDPLFNETNFLPSDDSQGTVTVENNTEATQTILTEAINVSDNDNLGSQLTIIIEDIGGPLYNDQLSDFLSTAGEVSLGTIASGATRTFTYTVAFINTDDNNYQGKTLGFDICVGFQGGTTHCGDTVVGDENGTDGGGGGGGGDIPGTGGGSSGSLPSLIIFNEQTSGISTTTATITWNTNLLSTSQVVYGLASGGPYILDLGLLNFGYPLGTIEDPTKVIDHSVFLSDLVSGETYLYRVVSRASPPTISFEHQFTVPSLFALRNQDDQNSPGDSNNSNNGDGEGSGSSSTITTEDANNGESESGDRNILAASALLSGFENILSICSLIDLLILLLIYLIWVWWLRKKYEKNLVSEEEIQNRFYLFFGSCSLLAIIVAILIREYCVLPVFFVAILFSLIGYCLRRL